MAEVLLSMMDAGGGTRRLAVLKRIGAELATDPDFVEMFLDEARLPLVSATRTSCRPTSCSSVTTSSQSRWSTSTGSR